MLHPALRGRVDLFRREQHHRLHRRSTRGVDRQRDGGSALVVGKVDDHVSISIAEREVEALERAADALSDLGDGVASAAARALDALDAIGCLRDLG